MAREIEATAGIPVVQIATIVPIMLTVGANRIVPGIAIPHPTGDPAKGKEADKAARRELIERAFKAMRTEISDQTIFKD
jgi:glycine reductase